MNGAGQATKTPERDDAAEAETRRELRRQLLAMIRRNEALRKAKPR